MIHNHPFVKAPVPGCQACYYRLAERRAYEAAMEAIHLLMEVRPELPKDHPGGVLLAGLAAAVDDYEQIRYPIGEPTEQEAAQFRAEQEGRALIHWADIGLHAFCGIAQDEDLRTRIQEKVTCPQCAGLLLAGKGDTTK